MISYMLVGWLAIVYAVMQVRAAISRRSSSRKLAE